MSAAVLRAHGVSVTLARRSVLETVDVVLEPGRLVVVIGPNGAGKTTLLRVLAGLLAPTAGSVSFARKPLSTLRGRERARVVAYLPQNGTVAWPLPVHAVVALGRLPHGEQPAALSAAGRRAVQGAIRAMDVAGFADRPVTELSGGERARALLARALATQAPVLLLDEPVSALDLRHQWLVLEALRAEARQGRVVAAVMHDLALAGRFADALILMAEGRVRVHGAPAEVLTPGNLEAAFGIRAQVRTEAAGILVLPESPVPAGG